MNIAAHITFYYIEDRLEYLRRILKNLSAIPHNIKVFIYSNRRFDLSSTFENVETEVLTYSFLDEKRCLKYVYGFIPLRIRQNVDPYYLAWKNRDWVEELIDRYDTQIYMEDDIGFTDRTFKYWEAYKDLCIDNDYNLGFLRYEVNIKNNRLYCTDLSRAPQKVIDIGDQLFLVNDVNVYCGFWIYDRQELKKFINSGEWLFDFKRYKKYKTREKSAIGWHGVNMNRYLGTLIPLKQSGNNTYVTHNDCKVHHFPDNYIGHNYYCRVEFPVQVKVRTEDRDNITKSAF